jgi:hypothetical protein
VGLKQLARRRLVVELDDLSVRAGAMVLGVDDHLPAQGLDPYLAVGP